MGSLREHNLDSLINQFDLEYYVETGTGEADCLTYALQHDFQKYYSIDIDTELVQGAYQKLGWIDKSLTIVNDLSSNALKSIVPEIPKESPTLFFLDAHFPGADFHKCTYEESIREHKKDAFPLEEEIEIITSLRDTSNDVFIIDDFILYEGGDYDTIRYGVIWRYKWLQDELDLNTDSQFIYDKFSKTHVFTKDLRSQGYLIVTPEKQ